MILSVYDEERFHSFYTKLSTLECWMWQGGVNKDGYGNFWLNGKTVSSHRIAYYLEYGEILKWILHGCDTPGCVNPFHLSDGSPKENSQERDARGRRRYMYGADNPSAKITESDVKTILKRRSKGEFQKSIAADFGVTRQLIGKIENGDLWSHLTGRTK